jgi:uncharacterized protein (DUF488 family)
MKDRSAQAELTVWTIGHSRRSASEFIDLLGQVAVDLLVDIRTVPRSRANPQFNRDILPTTLTETEIGYLHLAALGGLRGRRKDGAPSPNGLWRNEAFRNYADYAATDPIFRRGLDELIALARDHRTAIMCAEAVWWRCHRRIVADYLLVAGLAVHHILGVNQIERASLTPGAIPQADGALLYSPPEEAQLSLL